MFMEAAMFVPSCEKLEREIVGRDVTQLGISEFREKNERTKKILGGSKQGNASQGRGMDQEEKQRKLEVGRVKNKGWKRKNANELPTEGGELNQGDMTGTQEDPETAIDLAVLNERSLTSATEHSMLGHQAAGSTCGKVEEPEAMVHQQLQELQWAVQKRSEIILQLSTSLQVVLANRQQLQHQALQLSDEILVLQEQLQQASKLLMSRNCSCVELSQTQEQVSRFLMCLQGHRCHLDGLQWQLEEAHQSTRDQQQHLTQKDGIISELGEKLADAEKELSLLNQELMKLWQSTCVADEDCCWDCELHTLTSKLQKRQGNSLWETWHTADLPKASEKEQSGLKEQLASEQPAQEQPAVWARKTRQCPTETQELHTEIFRLSILILDLQQKLEHEEQSDQDLKFKTGRSNSELRVLGEEGAIDVVNLDGAHETALQCLREEHRDSIKKLKEQLTALLCYRDEFCPAPISCVKSGKTQLPMEMATGCDRDPVQGILGSSSSENHPMEKYLVMSEKWDSSCLERSNDGLNLLEQIGNYRFDFGSELELERSKSVNSVQEHTEQGHDDQSLIPEAGGGYVSLAMHDTTLHRLSEGSETVDLGKVLLMQQCRDVNEQLTKRDEQLCVLQEELRKSAVEFQEALQKWSSVTETLYSVHCELELGMCYQDDLRNELYSSGNYSELDRDVNNLIQKQKQPGVSVTSDVRTVFGHQPATLQMQNNELETQTDADMAKNQTASEPLAQKTPRPFSMETNLPIELKKCREKLDKATEVKAELESKLLCLQQNLTNVEKSLGQSSNERTAQGQCLMGLEFKANNTENIMVAHSEEYRSQLKEKTSDLEVHEEGRMTEEKQQKEAELAGLRKCLKEQEQLYKETLEKLCSSHQEEQKHQQVELHEEMESKPEELRHIMEKRQREQIMLIKQAHVRKHERESVELACRQEAELSHLWAQLSTELQESLEAAHQAELLQAQQEQHGLELEAPRLNLGEQQVAQVERTQDDLQHDSVVVLSELQASWPLESILLQTLHQRELVATGEDHQRELEEMKWAWKAKLSKQEVLLEKQHTTEMEESLQAQLGCSHVVELEQQHNSLHLQHQEELPQVKTILTDCYFQKIQELKSKYALELWAKLSDAHVKEITRVRLQIAQDVARQVGAELDRVQALAQEHEAYLVQLKQDFELSVEEGAHGEERKNAECNLVQEEGLQKDAAEEPWVQEQHLEKEWAQHAMQDQFDDEYSLQISAIAQKIFGQLQSERQSMIQEVNKQVSLREKQTEARLKEEQRQLAQQCEHDLSCLRKTHREELEVLRSLLEMYVLRMEQLEPRLCIRLKGELESLEDDLSSKHKGGIESLEAILQEPNMVQLEVSEPELHAEHWREEELQGRLLSNMEALESICCEKEAMLQVEGSSHVAKLEELRGQLAQAYMEKFTTMAVELGQAHKVELAGSLATQRQALEELFVAALGVLQQDVLALENQHSTTLQELREQQQAEELSVDSVHELEALHRELEEARHQKERFQVEIEVLQSQAQEQKLLVSQLERQLSKEHQQSQQPQQEVDLELSQLRVQISNLKGELEGRCSEMATLETLLQRRERENQEGCHLLAMLRADLTVAAEDRKGLQEVQVRLLKLLLDVLGSIVATEDLINQRINKGKPRSSPGKGEDSACCDSGPDSCLWSTLTESGLEHSQRLGETLLCGPEQLVLEACFRLRSAVDRLLEQMAQSEGVAVQSYRGKDDTAQLILLHKQLLEQLDLEASVKKQMELELHKAEGLMEGYVMEKATLEESLQQKESQEQKLVEELEAMRLQLQELSKENGLLLRQRDALSGVLGEPERSLLDETLRLAQEKLDVQRQAEKDHSGLVSQLRHLETELEEQTNRNMELEEQQQAHNEDLLQQIQALEKQLKHHRHFIDCQAMEREHEREEFQQEICKLEAQLKRQTRGCAGDDGAGRRVEDLSQQVESLQASMKEKLDDYSTLLLVKQKYQCEVAEQSEEIDRMAGCMRELEQELDRVRRAQVELLQVKMGLHGEDLHVPAVGGSLCTLKSCLLQDREALQQQQYSQCMQISALQSTVDEARHRLPDATPDPELRAELEAVQQDLLSKEMQVQMLSGQLEVLQRELTVKEEEVYQLNLQLDQLTKQNSAYTEQLQCEVTALQVSSLHRKDRGDNKTTSSLQLPLGLLEVNQDTDHLKQEIHQLQQEVDVFQNSKIEVELEDLRSLIDHLRNEQQHLRQQHEEEEEQLHGVIHKLQEEITQLGPSCLEVNEPQEKHRTLAAGRHTSSHDLQSRPNLVHSEKEALQLLHPSSQGETFRSQLESLGHSLEEDQQRAGKKDEVAFLTESLSQQQAQVEQLSASLQELEEHQRREKLSVVEKEELTKECQALKQREGWLQEEVEKLKQEVVLAAAQIQELNSQLEAGEVGYAEAHRDVLTCAETTLAKAEGALQDKGAELEALRMELAAVKEALSSCTERVEKLLEEGQMKDAALTELHIVNDQLKAELRSLRGKWQLQELHGQYDLQAMPWYSQEAAAGGNLPLLSTGVSAYSPEHLRCQDRSMGHGSRLSDYSSLELCSKEPSLPPESLRADTEPLSSCSPEPLSDSKTFSIMETLHLEQVEGLLHLDLTPPSTPGGSPQDFTSNSYGSNMRSELGARLQMELETTERLDANFLEYLRQRGMTVADSVVASNKLFSPELQGLLKKLNKEACQVLALSQRPCADAVHPEWQEEKHALQEAVLSLKELLCRMAEDGPKGQSNEADWRAELIQAVSTMLASEWHWLCSELSSITAAHVALHPDPLTKHLEQLLKQQDEHQRSSLQQLLSADRRSLLSELQSLQTQLRIASLQNQEQLQQMQNCLSAAQEEGSQQRHQLHRQVELLEFRLQQEQVLVQKLRSSLSLEQDIAAQLRTELEKKHTLLETTASSQQELHSETCRLRVQLESQAVECLSWEEKAKNEKTKVQELQQEVQHGQAKVQELQQEVQHGQAKVQELQQEVQHGQAKVQELQQEVQHGQAKVQELQQEVQHGQAKVQELQQEVQQGQAKVQELQQEVQFGQAKVRELQEVVQRGQAKMRELQQEVQRGQAKVRELQQEVQRGQAKVRELQQEVQHGKAKVRELQQEVHREQQCSQHTHVAQNQVVLQRALEQKHVQCSNLRKELQIEISRCDALILQESRRASQAVQQLEELTDSLTQEKQDLAMKLEDTRSLCAQLSASLMQEKQEKQDLTLKLEEASSFSARLTASLTQEKQEKQDLTLKLEEASSFSARLTASLTQEKQEKQDLKLKLEKQQGFHDKQQLDTDKQELQEERRDWQNQQERKHQRLLELEEQQQRINHFQQTLLDLQGMSSHACPQSQQQLQITQQQLQLARVRVTRLLHRAHSSCDSGWLQLKHDLQELLCTLTDLEQDLQQLNSQELSVAEEKARHTEWASLSEVVGPVTVADCAKLGAQVQRLYLKYLRAESFRKALVYQKKYLLLQLGGSRDCELATLSLLGLMGACPCPAAFKTRPTNRFRTTVCVIIAISRLRFLVRKWHKSVRRGAMNPASNKHGPGISSATRVPLPMQLQPGDICFPPTHKHGPAQRVALSPVLPPATSAFNLQNSPCVPRPLPYSDPEHSLSEYIQHLEAVQQRLGAVQKGSPVAVSFLASPQQSDP
ncbi:pericentrin isoform X11 [Brienomyrus brachyistius]|uniref:pericentrin isoform X11 n=1 Tax=Brienomyrus brachyistius TaxID=42636 RepID=UPI0020B39583|nr:pericentrin isoform X11 [Brienomyrus brachyistius]